MRHTGGVRPAHFIAIGVLFGCGGTASPNHASQCVDVGQAGGATAPYDEGDNCCSHAAYAGICVTEGCAWTGQSPDPNAGCCAGVGSSMWSDGVVRCNAAPNCTPPGAAAIWTNDGSDCCTGFAFAGLCADRSCNYPGQATDPAGSNCCAANGASMSGGNYVCNPIPNCVATNQAPPNGDPNYCCSGLTNSGNCT